MKPTPEAWAQLAQWQRTVFLGAPVRVKVIARQRQEPLICAVVLSVSVSVLESVGDGCDIFDPRLEVVSLVGVMVNDEWMNENSTTTLMI
jgi:hypothetical protein